MSTPRIQVIRACFECKDFVDECHGTTGETTNVCNVLHQPIERPDEIHELCPLGLSDGNDQNIGKLSDVAGAVAWHGIPGGA